MCQLSSSWFWQISFPSPVAHKLQFWDHAEQNVTWQCRQGSLGAVLSSLWLTDSSRETRRPSTRARRYPGVQKPRGRTKTKPRFLFQRIWSKIMFEKKNGRKPLGKMPQNATKRCSIWSAHLQHPPPKATARLAFLHQSLLTMQTVHERSLHLSNSETAQVVQVVLILLSLKIKQVNS